MEEGRATGIFALLVAVMVAIATCPIGTEHGNADIPTLLGFAAYLIIAGVILFYCAFKESSVFLLAFGCGFVGGGICVLIWVVLFVL